MLIKIDTREQELYAKCQHIIATVVKFNNIKLILETLPLGDIIINDGTNDCVIIERKSLSDLAASIKDGRYEEQSYRLNGLQHHNHNIIYLIEGDMNRINVFKDRIDKQTLYSAIFSINYFKGFSVMRSVNLEETAMIACNMVCKLVGGLKAGKHAFYSNVQLTSTVATSTALATSTTATTDKSIELDADTVETSEKETSEKETTEKDYCSVVKKVKKENITADNIGEIMLCQIPGVSSTSALSILSQFKTLPNLIKAINENESCLNNVCTTDANGKSRKISKTTIATIVKFLKQ